MTIIIAPISLFLVNSRGRDSNHFSYTSKVKLAASNSIRARWSSGELRNYGLRKEGKQSSVGHVCVAILWRGVITLTENVIRECDEEASIAKEATPAKIVSYCCLDTEENLKRDVLF